MKLKSVLIAGAMLVALTASAADYPKPIQKAVEAGLKVVTDFSTPSGLKGWVMQKNGQYSIVYTTADDKYLVTGLLIDSDGKNLNAEYAQQYVPKPDYEAAYKELSGVASITEGAKSDKNMMYVFFDANCIFCHMLWKALQPYEHAGLQVRWIPVAFLKKDSPDKAVALLTAKDGAAAMAVNMSKFNKEIESGGIQAEGNSPKDVLDKVIANNAIMSHFGSSGTPTIVWKDKAGQVRVANGMPQLSQLPDMTGLPEQKLEDPDLAQFK
jgi:thiol:disulfide interchange protein DsbG